MVDRSGVRTAPVAAPAPAEDPIAAAPPRDARRGLVLAVAGYLLARGLGLLVLAPWAARRGVGVLHLLATRSDAEWYLGIARHGYDAGQGQSNLAFFPLYPGLVAGVGRELFDVAPHRQLSEGQQREPGRPGQGQSG